MDEDLKKVGKRLVLAMESHETFDHAGEPCLTERINAIAFLCHIIAVQPEHFDLVRQRIGYYNRVCPCQASQLHLDPATCKVNHERQ